MQFVEPPDLLCDYQSVRVGLPCKLLYSHSEANQINRIVEAAKQLEESKADYGIIMVNATNLIPHDRFFSWREDLQAFVTFFEQQAAGDAIGQELARFAQRLNRPNVLTRLKEDRHGRQRVRGRAVLLFAQTLVSINGLPSLLSKCHEFGFRDIVLKESEFLDRFNHAAQMIIIDRRTAARSSPSRP